MSKKQSENSEKLTELMSKFIHSHALSKAIYEDYCGLAARIEGISPFDVQQRITTKTEQYFKDFKDSFKP